jgi:hypothetical protein
MWRNTMQHITPVGLSPSHQTSLFFHGTGPPTALHKNAQIYQRRWFLAYYPPLHVRLLMVVCPSELAYSAIYRYIRSQEPPCKRDTLHVLYLSCSYEDSKDGLGIKRLMETRRDDRLTPEQTLTQVSRHMCATKRHAPEAAHTTGTTIH